MATQGAPGRRSKKRSLNFWISVAFGYRTFTPSRLQNFCKIFLVALIKVNNTMGALLTSRGRQKAEKRHFNSNFKILMATPVAPERRSKKFALTLAETRSENIPVP